MGTCHGSTDEQTGQRCARDGQPPSCRRRHTVAHRRSEGFHFLRYKMRESQLQRKQYVRNHDGNHPSHVAEQHVGRHTGAHKLSRLAAVCLADQQQHGGRERGAELHEAVHIGERHDVEHDVEQRPHPSTHYAWQQCEHECEHINVEQELKIEVVIELCSTCIGERSPCAHASEHIHKHEKRHVQAYGPEHGDESPAQQVQYFHSFTVYCCPLFYSGMTPFCRCRSVLC